MGFERLLVFLLVSSILSSVYCHHHHRGFHVESKKAKDHGDRIRKFDFREEDINEVLSSEIKEKNRRSSNLEDTKGLVPFSTRRLEKMLEKAILKIITGDLSTADMLLLKSLNYSLEEVLAIRERELNKRKDDETKKEDNLKSWTKILYGEDLADKKPRNRNKNSMATDYSPVTSSDFENVKLKKDRYADKSSYTKDFDFDAYNRQAVIDYENLASKLDFQQSWSDPSTLDYEEGGKDSQEAEREGQAHQNFQRLMEPHVVFKIRYDDSEFDSNSNSDEFNKDRVSSKHHASSTLKHTTSKSLANSFHVSPTSLFPGSSSSSAVHTPLPVVYQLNNVHNVKSNYPKGNLHASTTEIPKVVSSTSDKVVDENSDIKEEKNTVVHTTNSSEEKANFEGKEAPEVNKKKVSEYEGLEWVEDDVYRVIPQFAASLGYENNEENETSDYDDDHHYYRKNWNGFSEENETSEYQNDTPDSFKLIMANNNASANNFSLANLSTYQQLAIAHRREGNFTSSFDSQGQKAIEDIKSRVLALTGRFNHSANANQVQRERLTMFSPTCQIPRNTDPDVWEDPFSMNMHFQLNLTTVDHIVAAKLRIFKLPQENLTSSVSGTFEQEEEDEKKIRISVYYYTKSLKKHRSKKRLMDSVVTPLTPEGTHLALDVRQGLRFWRLNPRNPHGNGSNHGLVIQVEDQDGRPLKPALYIQEPSCGEHDTDQKAYQRTPALFIRACTRYVRIVNGERVTYVNCRH